MIFKLTLLFSIFTIVISELPPPAKFQLNDPNHKGYNNRIYINPENASLINPGLPFKIIVHGYTEGGDVYYFKQIPDLYLSKGDYNVIGVDWKEKAAGLYTTAAANTKIVGRYLGEFLIRLIQTLEIDLDSIHLIGHSLGAHVVGFAGKYVIENLDKQINRISGLDPAGPLFWDVVSDDTNKRLAFSDAKMVDVIHTDGFEFGIALPIGTVDFYANGGFLLQPGCLTSLTNLLSSFSLLSIADYVFCSHHRSVWYFMESINSKNFVGKCRKGIICKPDQSAIFGDYTLAGTTGVYEFKTNRNSPYARGL